MATMQIGYRHSPKSQGNSAPSPFTNWCKGTQSNNHQGHQSQTEKFVFNGCTDPATKVKWGDKTVNGSMANDGKSGEFYSNDHYGTTGSSHNVLWSVKWAPYSMSAAGISFDFVQSTSSTGWGFGKMWLFYKNQTSTIIARELTPISGCKVGDGSNFTFHRSNVSTFGNITNYQDHSYGTRSHLIAGCSDPGDNYFCIGWGGFFSLDKQANVDRKHGFKFNNFYLLPSGTFDTSKKWIGGMCNNNNATTGRYILI